MYCALTQVSFTNYDYFIVCKFGGNQILINILLFYLAIYSKYSLDVTYIKCYLITYMDMIRSLLGSTTQIYSINCSRLI